MPIVPDAAVKLTDNREIAPYPWHHADDERRNEMGR
jgi:hypothetical protein